MRIWLEYVIKQASLCATNENVQRWIENSIQLGNQENDDISLVDRLIVSPFGEGGETSQKEILEEKRKLIEARIEKLEAFNGFNQKLTYILKQELENLSFDASE